jgi:hypothetical protein
MIKIKLTTLTTISILTLSTNLAAKTSNELVLPLEVSQKLTSINIYIENKKIPLIFDTGASNYSLMLSKKVLRSIKFKYTGTQTCSKTIDNTICMKDFIIPAIKIDHMTFYNVEGSELKKLWGGDDKGFIQTEASRNGLIGLKFLKQFNILLDYKNKKIILNQQKSYPDNFDAAKCNKIKFSYAKGILASMNVENKNVTLLLDTGSTLSFLKPDKFCKTGKHTNENCNYINVKLKKVGSNKYIGSEKFYLTNFPVPFDGILGATFIQNNLTFIDTYNKSLYIC